MTCVLSQSLLIAPYYIFFGFLRSSWPKIENSKNDYNILYHANYHVLSHSQYNILYHQSTMYCTILSTMYCPMSCTAIINPRFETLGCTSHYITQNQTLKNIASFFLFLHFLPYCHSLQFLLQFLLKTIVYPLCLVTIHFAVCFHLLYS